MKKRVLKSVLFCAILLVFVSGSAFAQLKLGYIDSQRILATYSEAVEAQKRLESETNKAGEEIKKMEDNLRLEQEKLEQQSLLLNEEKKRQKAQELQEMYLGIQQFGQEKQAELGRRQEELLKPIFDKINDVITKIGDSENYDFIFNGSVAGNLVYAKEQYDLTDKVLEQLSKQISSGLK